MNTSTLTHQASQPLLVDPSLADTGLDLLRLDATEWALLEFSWLEQSPPAFDEQRRAELIELLETGLAEIDALRPHRYGVYGAM
ncbi:MAG: hypothetical protein ACO26U_09525 [Burkholderiaceae bacterium]